jgi:uncharacterized repeat protein (TIGR01451 family)
MFYLSHTKDPVVALIALGIMVSSDALLLVRLSARHALTSGTTMSRKLAGGWRMRVALLGVTVVLAVMPAFFPAPTQSAALLDSQPSLSINDAMIIEGERYDAPAAVFTVSLFPANLTQEVSVDYLMVNDANAVLAAPPPESQRGTLVFAPGESVKTLTVLILFTSTEGVESFRVRLSNATNAHIAVAEGVGSTPVRFDPNRAVAAIVGGQPEPAPAGVTALADLLAPSANPQPAILGATGASNRAVVFPDPNTSPSLQNLVPGLPANASPHGVSYFGSDNALISDFANSRVFVVRVSTAALLSTINTASAVYDGTGTIAVAPNLSAALAMGSSTSLKVIQAPFNASSIINSLTLPGSIASYQTQAIVFNNAGRAFVYQTTGISVLDAPYTSVAFTIPLTNSASGAIAISPDGNSLLATIASGNQVRIFQAPFSPSSTPTLLTVPGGNALDGIAVTPNGSKAIVVSAFSHQAAAISAPFSSSSTIEALTLPAGSNGFEDVGISADSQLAILTGNSTSEPTIFIRAPFTAAGAQVFNVPLQTGGNTARGAGAVRFLPPGLAPGLTISKSAPASVPSGSNLTYTIGYSNTGSVNATNVIIRDPLPAGTTFVSATNGGTLTGANVVFNVGTVNAGTGAQTVSFTVRVTAIPGASVNNNNYTIEANGAAPIPGPPVTTSVTAPTFSISGRATDGSNNGINSVTVTLSGSQAGSTTTDTNGNYSFAGLTSGGSYTVTPSKSGLGFTPPSQTFNNIAANQTADFTGTPIVAISGRVTNGNNAGLSGVQVTLSGTLTRVMLTDANGNYSFDNLVGGGNYSVIALSPLYVLTPPRFDFTGLSGSQTANFVQVPQVVPSPTPPLSDDFDGAQRNPQKWNLGTATQPAGAFDPQITVAQTSGQLVITPRSNVSGPHYNGYVSVNAFDMTGGRAGVELVQAASGGADTIFALSSDSQNFSRFIIHTPGAPSVLAPTAKGQDGIEKPLDTTVAQLIFQVALGGPPDSFNIPYDPAQHRFMRFRHEPAFIHPQNGAIVFETSPDDVVYTVRHTVLLLRSVSALTAELSAGTSNPANPDQTRFDNFNLVTTTFQFSGAAYSVGEGAGAIAITVTRVGDTSVPGSVDFNTSDDTARQSSKYITASGTLNFAAGQNSRSFTVLIVDNLIVEGNRAFNVTLNQTGDPRLDSSGVNSPGRAVVTIVDNDTEPPTRNPLDDAPFFVTQHYYDFLSRVPDQGGLDFWISQITQCGTDVACLRTQRITVSNAFFYEQEYQQTGSYVVRLYRAAYGNNQPISNTDANPQFPNENKKLVNYSAFSTDRARVRGGPSLAQTQLELANAFVLRSQFLAKYPSNLDGPAYVDALLATIATDLGVNLSSQRTALIDLFNQGGRGAVLYRLADDNTVTNPINNRALVDAEYNRAFVLTQYFGYLRRNPDIGGFVFWLGQVNSAPLRALEKQRAMVCSFITSLEYQQRFSPVAPHNNTECQ